MRNSLRLGVVSGIPIAIHWSIALIAGVFGLALAGTILPAAAPGYVAGAYFVTATVVTVALLASIVAHELGHSVVAQRNDVDVSGITLFALGGVAKLEREPDTPGAAARIAIAGPAVSVAIGVAALATGIAAAGLGAPALVAAGLTWLGLVNLTLAVFNMLPALPLDGGRVLQAALWRRSGDRDRATISAASVGRVAGWLIIAFGAWQFFTTGAGLWTMVIGWFILGSAKAESLRARFNVGRRQWAPPQGRPWPGPSPWPGDQQTPWPGNGAGSPWPPPSGPPRPSDDVIDVEGQRIG